MADPPPDVPTPPIRPGDFARILLAASGDPPRARARDQQADMVGEGIRKRVLNRLVVLDPEPDSLESALMTIVAELGEPSGSTRAVCTAVFQEWEMARVSPGFWAFLIGQAMEAQGRPRRSRKATTLGERGDNSPDGENRERTGDRTNIF